MSPSNLFASPTPTLTQTFLPKTCLHQTCPATNGWPLNLLMYANNSTNKQKYQEKPRITTKNQEIYRLNKGWHGTDPWPTETKIFPFASWYSHVTVMRKSWDSHETVMIQSWGNNETVYSFTLVADLADMFVLVCSLRWLLSHPLNGWPHDHGPTNIGVMVKSKAPQNNEFI